MKLFLGIILLVLSVSIGYGLSKKFTKRREFYRSFSHFNLLVQREVAYSQSSIPKILQNVKKNDDFYDCVKNYYHTKEFILEKNYLNTQDLEFLYNYLTQLGKSDSQTQQKYIDGIENELSKKLSEVTELEKKYRVLYVKLGVLIGLIALIVCL